ncbi:MAG: hypothetical protein SFV54_15250 [Bryobacteraceae bacterium]|nr:hypothetical protein [Bryobacteraceae bacterium]
MKPGENLMTLVRATQRLHSEVAALLKTFEKLAGERGYVNAKDRSASNACSTSIDTPDEWVTPWMYRFLHRKADPDDVVILNVVLNTGSDWAHYSLDEPLAICARFRYSKGKAKANADYWDAGDICFFGAAKKLGTLYDRKSLDLDSKEFLTASKWQKSAVEAMQGVSFIAVPLAGLTDSKALERDILKLVLS